MPFCSFQPSLLHTDPAQVFTMPKSDKFKTYEVDLNNVLHFFVGKTLFV